MEFKKLVAGYWPRNRSSVTRSLSTRIKVPAPSSELAMLAPGRKTILRRKNLSSGASKQSKANDRLRQAAQEWRKNLQFLGAANKSPNVKSPSEIIPTKYPSAKWKQNIPDEMSLKWQSFTAKALMIKSYWHIVLLRHGPIEIVLSRRRVIET